MGRAYSYGEACLLWSSDGQSRDRGLSVHAGLDRQIDSRLSTMHAAEREKRQAEEEEEEKQEEGKEELLFFPWGKRFSEDTYEGSRQIKMQRSACFRGEKERGADTTGHVCFL